MNYVVLVDGKPGAYGVVFPDLPGCVAMGKTIDGALANAREVLRDWVELSRQHGERVPDPRPVRELHSSPDVALAIAEGARIRFVSAYTTSAR